MTRVTLSLFIVSCCAQTKRVFDMDSIQKANYEKLSERNNHRISILQKGCTIDRDVLSNGINYDFRTLHSLQKNISNNVDFDNHYKETAKQPPINITHKEMLVDLFNIDDFNIMTCLPPKTGTTNWQRFYAGLIYPDKKPEDFQVPEIFTQLPRISKKNKEDEIPAKIAERSDYLKLINVRHPFARLLSAWHQKFHRNFHNLKKYVRQFGRPEIEKFEDFNDENETVYSFEAFIKYVANRTRMENYDYHWKTMSHICLPCQVNYDIVTMQETSSSDAQFLLEYKKLHGLTYLPGQYNDSPLLSTSLVENFANIPRETIEKLYKIYFMDFVLFDYSIDEFLQKPEKNDI